MKKFLIIMVATGALAGCCSKQIISLEGRWVEPIPGINGVQGIDIQPEGVASSINMATLQYDSWKAEGDKLILNGRSIGNGQTITFSDTMRIEKLTPDSLILTSGNGYTLRYGACSR